jgi:hypothetical protein
MSLWQRGARPASAAQQPATCACRETLGAHPAFQPARVCPLFFRSYVRWVEQALGVHCKWIGVGPGRDAVVVKPLELPVAAAR